MEEFGQKSWSEGEEQEQRYIAPPPSATGTDDLDSLANAGFGVRTVG